MRKAQKEQIESFLKLLGRAHEEIKKAIASGNKEVALDLLGQCQDGAIQIGEMIEHLEGENFATIPLLEAYCEVVYQIYESLQKNPGINASKTYKGLQRSLHAIKNSVKNEINIRQEAVFLPYKASMWDSLESIWQAAEEDPDCDAYVIPIPYYDKNPDGSFKEMHYEGDLYPDYVPITDYQDYDFAEHCPDMIFIHNPYDECNYVTSVHPFFYSKNLKQYTEKLIYVPYFVLDEIDPENKEAIKGIQHFCTVPGVLYADQVVVQSEDMKKIYVNVLTEYSKGSKANRRYWEEKILGLGSPKIDKVLSTRKEEIEIPNEWKKIIEREDRSWKKIIFYNTSVTAFLEHEEKYLEKMRDVFSVFKENIDEVALLWRPHPLMQATIESMRPELWAEYRELVAEYQAEGWGIYDDTAELERAIMVCDGYYGDPSSVVKLCEEAGKSILLQDVDAEYLRKPFFYDCIWNEKELIYPLINYNALGKTDISSGVTTVISEIEEKNKFLLYIGAYKWKDYIILSSYQAKAALTFYNYKLDKWSYIPVEEEKKNWLNFREENVFEHDDFLYIFPYPFVILKVDIQKKKIEYIFYPDRNPSDDIRGEIVKVEEKIYIPMKHNNILYKFDLETEQIEIVTINTELKGIDTLCFTGNLFWMTGIGKMICSWDESRNISTSYQNFPEGFGKFTEREGEEGWWFTQSKVYNDSVYFVPSYANMLIRLDINTLEMKEVYIADEEEDENSIKKRGRCHVLKYGMGKQKNALLLLLSAKNKNLILIDLNTEEVKKVESQMQGNAGNYFINDMKNIVYEGNVEIKYWLENIRSSQNFVNQLDENKTVGKIILYQISLK